MPKKKKRQPTKLEIYEEIGAVTALLEKPRPDRRAAVERLKSLRNSMLGDIVKSAGNVGDELVIRQALTDILEGKQLGNPHFVHLETGQEKPAVCLLDGKFVYLHSHMLVMGNRNATDFKEITLDDKNSIANSVRNMTGEDYRLPGIESFACMEYAMIRDAIKFAKGSMGRGVTDEIVYQFKNGPALKATYYMRATLLTGAEKAYVRPGKRESDGKKIYNKIIYFPGSDFEAYVCPVMSTGEHAEGFRRWRDAF